MSEKESIPPLTEEEIARLDERAKQEARESKARQAYFLLWDVWNEAAKKYEPIAGGDELVGPEYDEKGRLIPGPNRKIEIPKTVTFRTPDNNTVLIWREGDKFVLGPDDIEPDSWRKRVPMWKVKVDEQNIERLGLAPKDVTKFINEMKIVRVNGRDIKK